MRKEGKSWKGERSTLYYYFFPLRVPSRWMERRSPPAPRVLGGRACCCKEQAPKLLPPPLAASASRACLDSTAILVCAHDPSHALSPFVFILLPHSHIDLFSKKTHEMDSDSRGNLDLGSDKLTHTPRLFSASSTLKPRTRLTPRPLTAIRSRRHGTRDEHDARYIQIKLVLRSR